MLPINGRRQKEKAPLFRAGPWLFLSFCWSFLCYLPERAKTLLAKQRVGIARTGEAQGLHDCSHCNSFSARSQVPLQKFFEDNFSSHGRRFYSSNKHFQNGEGIGRLLPEEQLMDTLTKLKTSDAVGRLKRIFSWPSSRPAVVYPENFVDGWFHYERGQYLIPFFSNCATIMEIGTWVGRSARFFHDHSSATIVCVDHWLGSVPHRERFTEAIRCLFDLFVDKCWDIQDRLIPVRMEAKDALPFLHSLGFSPDFIYVDGGHSYPEASRDLSMCDELWPNAILTGHDYWTEGVRNALNDFCAARGFKVEALKESKEFWRVVRPSK